MSEKARPVRVVAIEQESEITLPDVEELERQFAGASPERREPVPFTDATLTIVRNAPDDVQDRVVTLWFDDERWDVLRYGQTLTRNITPGPHRLKAHNTLLGTTFAFDIKPGEHVRLRCANAVAPGGTLLMLLIGWAMLRVRIERDDTPGTDRAPATAMPDHNRDR